MDDWKDIFEYDKKTEFDTEDNGAGFDYDFEIGVSEVFAINENGEFICAGDDFAEYVSTKGRSGAWL